MSRLTTKAVAAPAPRFGVEQVIVDPTSVHAGSEPAASKVVPAGSTSSTAMLLAFDGPALVTLRVKLVDSPAVAAAESATFVKTKSLT